MLTILHDLSHPSPYLEEAQGSNPLGVLLGHPSRYKYQWRADGSTSLVVAFKTLQVELQVQAR
jgi:hypothetical protein